MVRIDGQRFQAMVCGIDQLEHILSDQLIITIDYQ